MRDKLFTAFLILLGLCLWWHSPVPWGALPILWGKLEDTGATLYRSTDISVAFGVCVGVVELQQIKHSSYFYYISPYCWVNYYPQQCTISYNSYISGEKMCLQIFKTYLICLEAYKS